jgi:hypothetical protein
MAQAFGPLGKTLKNLDFAVPGVTLKMNDPVPALLVCSGLHWLSPIAAFVLSSHGENSR